MDILEVSWEVYNHHYVGASHFLGDSGGLGSRCIGAGPLIFEGQDWVGVHIRCIGLTGERGWVNCLQLGAPSQPLAPSKHAALLGFLGPYHLSRIYVGCKSPS